MIIPPTRPRAYRFPIRLGVLVFGAAIGCAPLLVSRSATPAPAKGAGDTAIPVGYVDVAKLLRDSPTAVKARREAELLKRRLQEQLTQQQELLFLTETEWNEVQQLQGPAVKSDPKVRITALQKQSQTAEQEWRTLQQITQPSVVQKSRLAELSQRRSGNLKRLQIAQQQAKRELDRRAAELMQTLQVRVLKAVEAVATAEKLPLVLDKQARLYGGRDITSQVIPRLKR